jgi:predicted nucleotide-binding protein (sugar kinase/HSP70/actin superfamily)
MAELVYGKDGRLLFTKEMKKEYTILSPQMLPIHFELIKHSLRLEGYKLEMLDTNHRGIVDEGLKYVHNDTCYPALLVIGQLLDAIKSGKYDPDKTALIITQTGGGCRASNYIHLLRKALKRSGYPNIPVVSLNLSGMEKNPGFSLTLKLLKKLILSVLYGDLLMLLANQCRPYENTRGSTDALVRKWQGILKEGLEKKSQISFAKVKHNFEAITSDFAALPVTMTDKIKVGVVGEIYIKYASLGNNNLEDFLLSEGVETVVPGVLDFLIFKTDNRAVDVDLYGGNPFKKLVVNLLKGFFKMYQNGMIETVKKYPRFRAPAPFEEIKKLIKGYLGQGNKMGEGWLLTAEMLELTHSGVRNIICTQPFGCLPNHVSGKGMIGLIKKNHPEANIVAVDYDPGATRINQENRIKLMLANAGNRREERA